MPAHDERGELAPRDVVARHESRGLHFNRDFPQALSVSFPTVLVRVGR